MPTTPPIHPDLERLGREIVVAFVEELCARMRKGDGTLFVVPEYVTPAQAAVLTGFSLKQLEGRRHRRAGPKFSRLGKRIFYCLEDLRTFMQEAQVE